MAFLLYSMATLGTVPTASAAESDENANSVTRNGQEETKPHEDREEEGCQNSAGEQKVKESFCR